MADWTAFAVAVAVLTVVLLFLTHRSQQLLDELTVVDDRETLTERAGVGGAEPTHFDEPGAVEPDTEPVATETVAQERDAEPVAGDERDVESTVAQERDAEPVAGDERDVESGTGDERDTESVAGDERDVESGTGDEAGAARVASEPESESTPTAADPGQFLTTRLLLGNVLLSQGLFLVALAGLAWWTDVPASAFGLTLATLDASAVAVGLGAGVVLYGGNELAARVGERFGFSAPEALRSAMAPTDRGEWALLLLAVLPTIAVFEELLFRGALIGALSVGFGLDPWLLVLPSSAVFGLGHGAQGRIGILVTASLGVVLGAVFVATGSLFVVVLAHYVINALEFVIQEGVERETVQPR